MRPQHLFRIAGLSLLCLLLNLVACSGPSDDQQEDSLERLFEDYWEFAVWEDPLLATAVGDHRYGDRLPEVTLEALDRQRSSLMDFLTRFETLSTATLEPQDRINSEMFFKSLEDALKSLEFGEYRVPLLSDSGFHTWLTFLPKQMPFRNTSDYENYLTRLRAFPEYFRQQIEALQAGIESGFTLPRIILSGYEGTIQAHVVETADQSVFFEPFKAFPVGVPEAERSRLLELGEEAISTAVVPSYAAFESFISERYLPNARPTIAANDLPSGQEYYAFLIQRHTTLDLSAQQIHELGLEEVERIRKEMDEVIQTVEFRGDFAAFIEFLRSDPRFYATSAEALLKEAAYIAKRMDAKLPKLFQTLPRQPYGVAPVPDAVAANYTAGRYLGAPLNGPEPGYFWVNTSNLKSRPLFTLEALTFHESVPGHHLQIALQKELDNLPAFRRYAGYTAFVEGWGLYAERLGLELGFYQDPYRNFGRLTYEMWRACRLVVDTGIHAFGWARQQALDYLGANTALSHHEVETEVDRYISWPGQALAYKMGELKIRELRQKAEKELGATFDVRRFHDAILLEGAVPLSVLDTQVDAFIQSQKVGDN